MKELDDQGVKVTVYLTGRVTLQSILKNYFNLTVWSSAHLNIDGDIYQSAANQSYWLTTDTGETLLQVGN